MHSENMDISVFLFCVLLRLLPHWLMYGTVFSPEAGADAVKIDYCHFHIVGLVLDILSSYDHQ